MIPVSRFLFCGFGSQQGNVSFAQAIHSPEPQANTRSVVAKCLAFWALMNPDHALGVRAAVYRTPAPGLTKPYYSINGEERTRMRVCLVAASGYLQWVLLRRRTRYLRQKQQLAATHRWPSGIACWKG